ncbi:MAG: transporter substrate-binding domain-containing protein [Pseudomonadota bacterium]
MASLPALAVGAPTVVTFPRPESEQDTRNRFPYFLLEQALQRSGRAYRLRYSDVRMQQGRAVAMLEKNQGIDIVCFMTSAEREATLLPIRIPIDKGLIGWRLILINKSQAERWSRFASVVELKSLTAGQGSDWPDFSILRDNGFKVYGTSNYDSLFSMLQQQRIDYFPRAVSEIWYEADAHKDSLMVAPRLAFRYTTASYFFVRKGQERLAADITLGLDSMIADGSYEKLFQHYYGDVIRRSGLRERQVVELNNSMLPDGIPAERRKLLFRE